MADNQNSDDLDGAIPTSGIKPIYIAVGAGVVFAGLAAWLVIGAASSNQVDDSKGASAKAGAEGKGLTKEEKKRNLKALKAGLAKYDKDQSAAAAKKKAAEEAKKQEEEEKKQAAASKGSGNGSGGPRPSGGGKKAAKDLDDLGKDLEAALQ